MTDLLSKSRIPPTVYWKIFRLQGNGYLIKFWTKPDNALTFTAVTTDPDKVREKICALTGKKRFELMFTGYEETK